MLKYKPKQFWGLLKSGTKGDDSVPVEAILKHNKEIFHDANLPIPEF
jgi:hypothetical protein